MEMCTFGGGMCTFGGGCALLMGYCAFFGGNCAFLVGNYALLMGNRADWVLRGAWKIEEETLPIGKAAESFVWRATVNMVVSRGVVQQWSNGPFTITPTHTHLHYLFSYPFHGRGLPHTMKWLRLLLHSFLKRTEHTPPPSTGQ